MFLNITFIKDLIVGSDSIYNEKSWKFVVMLDDFQAF